MTSGADTKAAPSEDAATKSGPSWFSKPTNKQIVEAATKDIENPVVSAASPQMTTFTPEEKAALSRVHWWIRIVYMIIAINLAACAAVVRIPIYLVIVIMIRIFFLFIGHSNKPSFGLVI
jgi:fatty acid desaturase